MKNNAALVLMSTDEVWELGTLRHKRSGKCLGVTRWSDEMKSHVMAIFAPTAPLAFLLFPVFVLQLL